MSKIKNATAKKENSSVLVSLVNAFKNVKIKQTTERERTTLYKYPENLNTEEKRNGKYGKAFRCNLRKKLEHYANNALKFVQLQDEIQLKLIIESFDKFYKENYLNNNYTLDSITQKSADENSSDEKKNEIARINALLEIVKAYKIKGEKKAPAPRKKNVKKEVDTTTPNVEDSATVTV